MQLIGTADMYRAYENLRDSHASVRSLNHFLAALPIASNVNLAVVYTFSLQEGLGGIAKGQ